EARLRAVLIDGRGADRKRPAQRPDYLLDLLYRMLVASGDRVDHGARERHARRDREAVPQRLSQPDGLGSEQRGVTCIDQRDDTTHPSTVTSPASPSTRSLAPSAMRSVASRVPTTPGMPYSRATIAECDSSPPLSVTIAPSSGSRMLNASVVDSVSSTSPCWMRPNSDGPPTRRAGPS